MFSVCHTKEWGIYLVAHTLWILWFILPVDPLDLGYDDGLWRRQSSGLDFDQRHFPKGLWQFVALERWWHARRSARRSAMRKALTLLCEQMHAPPDQMWGKLAAWSTQRKRKSVGRDFELWMFLILRTGSSVGFAAGDCDCEISVGFAAGYREQLFPWALRRDSRGTALVAT